MNKAILSGNLTRDPELRYTPSGIPVTNFSVATNDGYGEKQRTEFHNIVVWGHNKDGSTGGAAVACATYLQKGSKVLVEGRIQTREWESQEGQKRRSTEVVVDFGGKVEFLSGTKSKQEAAARESAPPASSAPEINPDDIPF